MTAKKDLEEFGLLDSVSPENSPRGNFDRVYAIYVYSIRGSKKNTALTTTLYLNAITREYFIEIKDADRGVKRVDLAGKSRTASRELLNTIAHTVEKDPVHVGLPSKPWSRF